MNIVVDSRIFTFSDEWLVMKYDDTPFYQKYLKNQIGWKTGLKGVDLIAFDSKNKILYLIESKDYRNQQREKTISPAREFFEKVLDTFTGIIPTILCSNELGDAEKKLQKGIQRATKLRLVYQFEQPAKTSKLFPRVYDRAELQQKLQQQLRRFDPHTRVIEKANQHTVPWLVQ